MTKTTYGLIVWQFNKLRQTGNLESYIDHFGDLRGTMLEFNPTLTKLHFLHGFVSRLYKEIKHAVIMFKPQSLEEAYEFAKNKEKRIKALRRRGSYLMNPSYNSKPVPSRPIVRSNVNFKTTTK